ncbi:MAG: endonuclease/exonuclease/phosphatase family protein [Clostridia bacterium]|nr:endonuclease/exonuclease/phosphatase family protein [Clostridia bacterium]
MITLMSYNTQHCRSYLTREINFDIFADEIKKVGADIIGLNEMRGEGPREDYTAQTETLAKKLGFNYYFAKAFDVGGENPYGNALLSRYPICSAVTVAIPNPESGKFEPRCVLKAIVDTPMGKLLVLVTHFGLSRAEHDNAHKTVLSLIENEKCVLMGDFNITPDNPIISDISQKMTDTAKYFDTPKLSFPSDFPNIKIDYMFTSRDIKVCFADIPAHVTSDHRPYVIKIGE